MPKAMIRALLIYKPKCYGDLAADDKPPVTAESAPPFVAETAGCFALSASLIQNQKNIQANQQ